MSTQSPSFAPLTSLVPCWSVSSRVSVFCTTRAGGVSQPPFDTLNLGLHVGDKQDHVLENRRRLEDSFALPGTPVWLNQTHSSDVLAVGAEAASDGESASNSRGSATSCNTKGSITHSADGSWTTSTDTVLAVLTADCLPVVISDRQGTQIAVVHAGWRGLAAGILENALATFPSSAELHAWLGPAIGPSAFEVGSEVKKAFVSRHARHESAFSPEHSPGKCHADLYALARREMMNARSVAVCGGDYCTYTQSDRFHSHRRDGVLSGRMATIAWISAVSE